MFDDPERVVFRVLGPFEVVLDGGPAPLGGARQRLVLAGLVANANAVVSSDRLIDIVWGDEPPNTALSTLQKYVHRLRALVGERLLTRAPGYLLRIEAGESDASRFESLLADATRLTTAGELGDAIATFDAALGLWRGPAWAEFADFDFARTEVARLDGLRATAIEDRMEAALAAGRHGEVIGELQATATRYPLRERPRAQLMLALYRSGRHADAVRAYDAFRRYLGEEVGLEPSASLAQLADAVLLQKPELDWVPPPGARGRPALPSGMVTFLFTDIEGSTRLFRQVGRAYVELLERHRRLVRGAVATAGGVEVYSEGDGLFFAFASARAALGASVAAQRALVAEEWPPGAEVRVRMALHTGEATPEDGDYHALAVHQAVRVRDAAHGGQVLLSQATVASIGGDVPNGCSVRGLGRFPLRDFDEGVELFEACHPALPASFPPPRVGGSASQAALLPASLAADVEPLIGRTIELEWLEVLWQRAVAGEGVTALVHGPPGIGKSRLLAEFARRAHAAGARVTVAMPETELAGPERLLVVLDDFDGPALHVLRSGVGGVLVLAASRQPIAGTGNTRELSGLSADEVGLLLAHKIETVTLDLSGAIHSETEGNPGQVHDVARRLREHEAEERVQRALERVGTTTLEARALRDAIASGVLERERLAARGPDGITPGLCPYKGLARYEAADASFFHGRERLVATLVARIAVDRFVGIIGASGSGKSSLVRAGLLPALSGNALPGSGAWPACACTPGEHPLRSLAEALAPLVGVPPPELARRLDRQPDELGAVIDAALRGRGGSRVVVVVDQFEEIVTLCRDQQERERFAGALVDAVTDPDVPAVVVPVVRADYFGSLAVHPELARLFEQSQVLVGAMTDAELRRAITEPARRAGLALEDGLADAVCADAGSEPGTLPLVSTAMAETWVRRDGTTLTLAAYTEAGGVQGALARLADDVYAGLDAEGQVLAQRLFLRLAEPGEGTDDVRRRMPRDEFSAGPVGDEVLDAYVDRRLLVADGGSVEVAHEALLREWPRLRAWLEEDREGRRLHRHLTDATAAWAVEGRDPGALYRGTRLGAAQDWASLHPDALNAAEREFLDASAADQQRELTSARRTARRLRSLAVAMAAFLAVALVAGGLALVQRSHAKHQAATARREATIANDAKNVSAASSVASQARVLATEGQLAPALLLAVETYRLDPSTATEGALESVLSHVPAGLERQVPLLDTGALAISADVSPDGRLIVSGGTDGIVRLYDLASGRLLASMPQGRGAAIQMTQFSADGSRFVGTDLQNNVFVWDVANGNPLVAVIHAAGGPGFTRASFAGDDRIVTATQTNGVKVWDVSVPGHPVPMGAPYKASLVIGELQFAPHTFLAPGSDLLAFDNAGRTEVWNIKTHALAFAPLRGATVGESPDGSVLVTAAAGEVFFWNGVTGQAHGQPLDGFNPQNYGPVVLFSHDGQRVAIPSGPSDSGGKVTVLDFPSGKRVGIPVPGQTQRYLDDGRVAIGVDQTIELWHPGHTEPTAFTTVLGGAPSAGPAHWLSDGTALPSRVYGLPLALPSAGPGPALEWDAASGKLIGDLFGRPQPPALLQGDTVVNRDGTLAALTDGDKIELMDIAHDRQVALFDTGQQDPIPMWDPAGNILATTGRDGTLAFWDTSNVADIRPLGHALVPGHNNKYPVPPTAFFSPDGQTIAIQNLLSPTTALVSVPDARTERVFAPATFAGGAVFTSDSKTVATVDLPFTSNGQVNLWDVATGNKQATLTVPYPELGAVAFVNADQWLVTAQSAQIRDASPDQVISRVDVWDVKTHQPIGDPIRVPGDASVLEIDRPGGYRLVSGSTAPTAGIDMVWDFDPTAWVSTACGIAGRNLTQSEWKQFLPDKKYQVICPQWPAGP
jgi:DNA-binding SARP family transcriptional activator/class 3 adenylate cyclase/WD40 repeat protein/energy-coupling factor transporter ATP-binding protein EcfA2